MYYVMFYIALLVQGIIVFIHLYQLKELNFSMLVYICYYGEEVMECLDMDESDLCF